MDYINPNHQRIIAGILGHSNMGFGLPNLERRMLFNFAQVASPSADNLVEWFCQARIEDNDSYDYCRDEIESWFPDERSAAEVVQKHHPDVWAFYLKTLMAKRWDHAAVAVNGASNQRLLSRCLYEAIVESQDEKTDLKADSAVQLLCQQVAHLLGQGIIMGMKTYAHHTDKVTNTLAMYERWKATIKPHR